MTGKFLRGFLDGSLSTLGIVIGASSASGAIIIAAALGGTLANSIANLLSAFSAEGADSYRELRQVEEAMVSHELKGSEAERLASRRTIRAGAFDGFATLIGGTIPMLPYLFLSASEAMLLAITLVVVSVSLIGIYMGRLSRRNIFYSAIKMAVFAIAVATVVYFVQLLVVP